MSTKFCSRWIHLSQVILCKIELLLIINLYCIFLCFVKFAIVISVVHLIEQPDTALRELNAIRGKWPLVILYNKRYRMLMEVLIGSCLKLGKLKECSLLQKDLTVIYTTRLKGAKDLSAQRREPECMLMYDVVYCWRLWS